MKQKQGKSQWLFFLWSFYNIMTTILRMTMDDKCAQSEVEWVLVSIGSGDSETKIGGPSIKPQLAHHLKVSTQPTTNLPTI